MYWREDTTLDQELVQDSGVRPILEKNLTLEEFQWVKMPIARERVNWKSVNGGQGVLKIMCILSSLMMSEFYKLSSCWTIVAV